MDKILKSLRMVLFFCLFFVLSSLSHADDSQLKLSLLIEEALQNNLEILASKKRWEAYKEKPAQASALEDPMLGLGIVNLPATFSFKDEDMTMKEISISQKIPFPGKRPLLKGMAEKEAEAVSLEISETSNRIVRDVKTIYFDLAHIHQSIEVTLRNKEILDGFVKIAETQYGLGMGMKQDVIKAHIEVSKMVEELIMLDQRKKALEAKLISVLNRFSETPLGRPEATVFKRLPFTAAELGKLAQELNPTLKRMKTMIEGKGKAHSLAKREYYPDFNVRFAYGQRDNGWDMSRRDVFTGMVEINIPIFFKQRQDRKVVEAKLEIQAGETQYKAMTNEILFMIAELSSMIQRTEKQLQLYKTGIIPLADLQINSALSGYRVGKADFMTLLDSRLTLYRYELEYHQALTDYHKSVASLEAVVGRRLD